MPAINGLVHLAAGGESPRLEGGVAVFERYEAWKSDGMAGRAKILDEAERVRALVGDVTAAHSSWVGFPANVATGMSLLAQSLDLAPTDSVVVPEGEFPSLVYPWAGACPARMVVARPGRSPQDEFELMREAVDERTRVIALSLVSYYDGRRRDISRYRALADAVGAFLVVDASHALGSIRVPIDEIDFLFSTSYKWQLGVHGCAIAVWNKSRAPEWGMRAAGWSSAVHEVRSRRGRTQHVVVSDGRRFELGNAAYLSVHLLGLGLSELQRHGLEAVETHNLALSGVLLEGLASLGVTSVTPHDPAHRAGNVAVLTRDDAAWESYLRSVGVVAWAGQGRLRMSTHVYNSRADVEAAIGAVSQGLDRGLSLTMQ